MTIVLMVILYGLVFGLTGILLYSIIYSNLEPNRTDNDIFVCPKCDIAVRGMMLRVSTRKDSCPSYNRMKCPHCEKKSYFDKDNDRATPFAPRLTLKQRREFDKALKSGIYTSDADKQAETYLRLQQEKLDKMKKGEEL